MHHFFSAFLALLALVVLSRAYNFARNVLAARTIALPSILVPVDHSSVLWLVFSTSNRRRLQRLLPTKIWQRLHLGILGWEFHEKLQPFKRLADPGNEAKLSYLVVGLGHLEFWTADPQATQEILSRVRDFEVPQSLEPALAQYGPNVLTTNGDRWARHRRIVTSVISERISKTVFEESISQTQGLLHELFQCAQSPGGAPEVAEVSSLFDMLKKITIHVLMRASMGSKVSWNNEESLPPKSQYTMTHIESLETVVTSLVGIGLIPTGLLLRWPLWIPGHNKMRAIGHAKVEVYQRSKIVLQEERDRRARDKIFKAGTNDSSIMSKLLQASENTSTGGQSLTEPEMISNLFIFTAAGFETTATSLAYACVLLARYPDWQEWILEEVDQLASVDGIMLNYETTFPRATRILAFMLETVRLYSPVPHMHREITKAQVLQTSTDTICLPAHTRIYVNAIAHHLLPSWRDINRQSDPPFVATRPSEADDEYAFRPSRWVNPPGSTHPLFRPQEGMFVPWSMGPRVCPGQKMAQVEFTAVVLTLLRRHRLQALGLEGEKRQGLEQRLDARLRDSDWWTVLQMNGVFGAKGEEGLRMRISGRR